MKKGKEKVRFTVNNHPFFVRLSGCLVAVFAERCDDSAVLNGRRE